MLFVFQDGIVTKEEWINMWTNTLATIKSGQPFPSWQQQYMEFMFYANDTSGWYTLTNTLTNTRQQHIEFMFYATDKSVEHTLITH